MVRAASSYVYVKHLLHPGLLEAMTRAGAEAIEIFAARDHFDYTNRQQVREIAGWFKDGKARLNSVHAPMWPDKEWGASGADPVNIAEPDRKRRIESMDEVKRALEVAEQMPFRFLVQHIGVSGETFNRRKADAALESLEHLRAFARPLGVTICVENIPNELSTPEQLLDLLNGGHFDDLGVCLDVGHAHIMGGVPQAYEALAARVRTTHLHDNAQDVDAHLLPGDGTIDWKETVGLIAQAPQVPPFLLELNGEGREDLPGYIARAYAVLEKAAA
jgi:sugar phosphate isomerase/epimerase